MLRKLKFVSLFIVIVLCFTGCKNKKLKPREITFYHYDTENAEIYKEIASDFTSLHPNIKVKTVAVDYNEYDEKLYESSKKKKLFPDVFFAKYNENYNYLLEEKKLLKLKDLSFNEYQINEEVLEFSKKGKKIYSIPMTLNTYCILYNKDIFEKENIPDLENMSDLIITSQILKEKGYTPITLGNDIFSKEMALRLFEGTFINSNNELSSLDEKIKLDEILQNSSCEQVILYYKQLCDDGLLKTSNNDKANLLKDFSDGKFVMTIGNNDSIVQLKKYKSDFKVGKFSIPGSISETKTIVKPDIMLCVNKKAKNKDEAKMFLEYVMSKNVAKKLLNDNNNYIFANELVEVKYEQNKFYNNFIRYGCMTSIFDKLSEEERDLCKEKAYQMITSKNLDEIEFIENWKIAV